MGATRTGRDRQRQGSGDTADDCIDGCGFFRCCDLVRCGPWRHLLRCNFKAPALLVASTLAFASAAAITHLVVGAGLGPYAVGHRRGSFEETTDLGRTVVVTSTGLLVWALVANPVVVPRSVPVVAGTLAWSPYFAARFMIRSRRSRHVLTGERNDDLQRRLSLNSRTTWRRHLLLGPDSSLTAPSVQAFATAAAGALVALGAAGVIELRLLAHRSGT
jgi:hypothetical protein